MKRSLLWVFLAALALACTSSRGPVAADPPAQTPERPPAPAEAVWPISPTPSHAAPRSITFPEDDGPHDALTEWWYYNGHLTGAAGQGYGFELVIFKRQSRGGWAGYAAHVAVTDHQQTSFQFAEDLTIPPPTAATPGSFDLTVGKIAARGAAGWDALRGATEDYSLELELRPLKPPALHGETGYIGVGASDLSYYYSRTRMAVTGMLRYRGDPVVVTGQAWMDHQWGDFSLQGGGGWDWFGVQLDDGREIMASVVRDGRGRIVLAYGTLVDASGETAHLSSERFRTRSSQTWTSTVTGNVYPMGWTFEVPDHGIDLRLEPIIPGQEMVTTASVNAVYWEGEVAVTGWTAGGPVKGLGYVELTGYGASGEGSAR